MKPKSFAFVFHSFTQQLRFSTKVSEDATDLQNLSKQQLIDIILQLKGAVTTSETTVKYNVR